MKTQTRFLATVVFAGAAMTGMLLAQGAPAPQTPPAPAAPAAPAGRGRQGGAPAAGAPAPARRGGFTQFTRPVASQDVVVRGKGLYEANCASCHAVDLRGGVPGSGAMMGPNLLHSGVALSDKQGELVTASVGKHMPAITLVAADTTAIAEYIHSVLATTGGQGSPPGRNPTGVVLNVLVGDAAAGQAAFGTLCSSCHSVTGDLKGIGTTHPDPRDLQNSWVAGSGGAAFGGGGRGGGGGGNKATVTMADGSKIEGSMVRKDDFIVILTMADGSRKSIPRNPATGLPKVDVEDPQAAHKAMILKLDDAQNKKMHDITAYLATIK